MERVVFRVDSSLLIGTGHVMRCLTLAARLRSLGVDCAFICRSHEGGLAQLVNDCGFSIRLLSTRGRSENRSQSRGDYAHWLGVDWEQDAKETAQFLQQFEENVDWLVVDHYALGDEWEANVRPHCKKLMVIDDLANRRHDCDLLLDQNLASPERNYSDLVPSAATTLIGPKYALLRPEFEEHRAFSLERRARQTEVRHILISMGGIDKDNATAAVLTSICSSEIPDDTEVTVVLGSSSPWLNDVTTLAGQMPFVVTVLTNVGTMAKLMSESDIAIGAAGSTSWERCCLGLPTIQIVLAKNQAMIARELDELGAATLGEVGGLTGMLNAVFKDDSYKSRVLGSWQSASAVTDGLGANRVAATMLGDKF